MQEGDYADDPVLEKFLQLLAIDRSKVICCGSLALLVGLQMYRHNNCMAVKGMNVYMKATTQRLNAGK